MRTHHCLHQLLYSSGCIENTIECMGEDMHSMSLAMAAMGAALESKYRQNV